MQVQASILDKIKSTVASVVSEAEVFLYGSQARGDAGPESDVDILILLPNYYEGNDFVNRKLDISGKLYDLSLAIGVEISPLILVPKIFFARKTPFTNNVLNEGIRL